MSFTVFVTHVTHMQRCLFKDKSKGRSLTIDCRTSYPLGVTNSEVACFSLERNHGASGLVTPNGYSVGYSMELVHLQLNLDLFLQTSPKQIIRFIWTNGRCRLQKQKIVQRLLYTWRMCKSWLLQYGDPCWIKDNK